MVSLSPAKESIPLETMNYENDGAVDGIVSELLFCSMHTFQLMTELMDRYCFCIASGELSGMWAR